MKLAHIVPISLLDTVPKNQTTHLVLSELVLKIGSYHRFYSERRCRGDFLILDNPVHENRPITIDDWLQAVLLIMPDVAVIPDVIDSDVETIANVEKAVEAFTRQGFGSAVELMAVPHGYMQQNWLDCAHRIAAITEISWLGLSLERRLKNDSFALIRRRERVEMLRTESACFDRLKLHLLGLSETGEELGDDRVWQRATSVDTSKFAVWSMFGTKVRPPVPTYYEYPGRAIFGGGFEYFYADRPLHVSGRKMRSNLQRWVRYAERNRD